MKFVNGGNVMRNLYLLFFFLTSSIATMAADPNNDSGLSGNPPPPPSDTPTIAFGSSDLHLVYAILAFCLIAIGIESWTIIRAKLAAEYAVKMMSITLILAVIMVIMSANFSDQKVGTAIASIGTIAGYLLGKDDRSSSDKRDREKA